MKLAVVGLYVGLAVYVWIDFVRLPPDGLANLGLMIVTLPVTIVGLLLTWATGRTGFVLQPDRFGYHVNHALYYWPSVFLTAAALYWISGRIQRWF